MIPNQQRLLLGTILASLLAGCGDGSSSLAPQPINAASPPPVSGPANAGAAADPVSSPTPLIVDANGRTIAARRIGGAAQSRMKDNVGSSTPIMPPPAFR